MIYAALATKASDADGMPRMRGSYEVKSSYSILALESHCSTSEVVRIE